MGRIFFKNYRAYAIAYIIFLKIDSLYSEFLNAFEIDIYLLKSQLNC